MNHPLLFIASVLVLASGCRHANLPTLPASHGELSRVMGRYLDDAPEPDTLLEGVSPPMYDTKPRVEVEPTQAPAVMAEALQVLEADPTDEQVQQALADLTGACHAPLPAACDAIRERWENPKRLSMPVYALPLEAKDLNAATVAIIQCMRTVKGRPGTAGWWRAPPTASPAR